MARKLSSQEVLRYSPGIDRRGTVRRHYDEWRLQNGIPQRCDITDCQFHANPLIWNNKPLTLILDHIDKCRDNNIPENLRLLCPNCDSQLDTKGGRNKNRIQNKDEHGYETVHRDGRQDATLFPQGVSSTAQVGKLGVGDDEDE